MDTSSSVKKKKTMNDTFKWNFKVSTKLFDIFWNPLSSHHLSGVLQRGVPYYTLKYVNNIPNRTMHVLIQIPLTEQQELPRNVLATAYPQLRATPICSSHIGTA